MSDKRPSDDGDAPDDWGGLGDASGDSFGAGGDDWPADDFGTADERDDISATSADSPSKQSTWSSRWHRVTGHRRTLLALGVGLVAMALVGSGFALGWTVATRQTPPVTETRVVEIPVPQYDAGVSVTMPDVRGLPQQEAQQAMADAGIPAAAVTLTSKGFAGQTGIIVEQSPLFGTANPTAVQLVASAPATVPQVVGRPERDATDELMSLGARVDRSSRFVPGTAPGVVVDVQPPAGTALADAVALTVSEAPSSIYLSQLERLSGGCGSADESLNGKDFADSVQCPASNKPQLTEWLIDRAGEQLLGTLGVPDDGPADAAVNIRILADGAEVGNFSATYGKPTQFQVPVAGALRLGVEVTAVGLPERTSTSWYAVLGDARLEGSTAAIDDLSDDS